MSCIVPKSHPLEAAHVVIRRESGQFRFVIVSDEVAAATEESKDPYSYHESRFS
jgi:hypothetical protein